MGILDGLLSSKDNLGNRVSWVSLLSQPVVLENGRELREWELGRHDSRGWQIGSGNTGPTGGGVEPFGCFKGRNV